VRFWGTV